MDRPAIEVFRRRADGWEVETCGAADALRLTSMAFAMPVTELYRDLPEQPETYGEL